MAFLSPLFLAGALAASIPIVLHLLRREPEGHVKFAAVRLLQSAPVEQTQPAPVQPLGAPPTQAPSQNQAAPQNQGAPSVPLAQ